MHGTHACGISLSEVSVEDFANAVDSEDRFVEGGYGALVERAAAGVSPRLGVTVRAIHETASGVRVETDAGEIAARAVLVTVPTTLDASEAIRFAPGLPETHREALQDLPHGTYERLVFTLGDDPFTEERDRAVILLNDKNKSFYMWRAGAVPACISPISAARRRASWRLPASTPWRRWWRDWLDLQVGSAVARSIKPLHASILERRSVVDGRLVGGPAGRAQRAAGVRDAGRGAHLVRGRGDERRALGHGGWRLARRPEGGRRNPPLPRRPCAAARPRRCSGPA